MEAFRLPLNDRAATGSCEQRQRLQKGLDRLLLKQTTKNRKGRGLHLKGHIMSTTLPTLPRRLSIYLGWREHEIGVRPNFPIDRSLVLAAAGHEARAAIAWHEKRLRHLRYVLRKVEADGRKLRRNGNGNSNGHNYKDHN